MVLDREDVFKINFKNLGKYGLKHDGVPNIIRLFMDDIAEKISGRIFSVGKVMRFTL